MGIALLVWVVLLYFCSNKPGLLVQQQAWLVRMPSRPPRHRRPDHRMRMNASPVSEQLAGLVAFG